MSELCKSIITDIEGVDHSGHLSINGEPIYKVIIEGYIKRMEVKGE